NLNGLDTPHVAPPHDIRAVGKPTRMLVIGGAQQKRGGVDRAARHDDNVRRVRGDGPVLPDYNTGNFAAGCAGLEPLDIGVCHQPHVGIFQRRIYTEHLRIGLCIDQAWEAIAGVTSNALARMRVFFVEHHTERRMEGPQPSGGRILGQLLDAGLMTYRRMRRRSACGRVGGIFTALAVNVIPMLRLSVIRFQLVVLDRPRRRNSPVVFDGTEILAPKPEQRRAIKFRIAANAVVGVGVEWIAVSIVPDFFGLVFALNVYGAGAPVVLLAGHVVTAFQQENPLACRRQLAGESSATRARADDDHVIMTLMVHEVLRSYSGRYSAAHCGGGIWRRICDARRANDGRVVRQKPSLAEEPRSTPRSRSKF